MSVVYEVPVGPVHPALKEPVAVKCYIEGEEVVDVDVILGQNHRGIEWIGMNRDNPVQSLRMASRVCGICTNVHPLSLVQAVEAAADIEVPERADYIRAIMLEVDRIHSHLLWAGVAAHELGFDTLLHYTWKFREEVMDLAEYISGNRVTFEMEMYGGVRRDIPPEKYPKIIKAMNYYEAKFEKLVEMFLNDKTIALRTVGVGVLSREEALKLCLVGPTTRARGVKKDVRVDLPTMAYADLDIEPVTPDIYRDEVVGDVYDNIVVRLFEVKQSIDIIRQCLDQMPNGPILAEEKLPKLLNMLKKASGEGFGLTEAPRGEVVHYVKLKEMETFYAWKIRASTYNNIPAWEPMLIGAQIADIPIIVASIDPCLSCTNRAVVLDGGKEKVLSHEDLHRLSVQKTRRLIRYGK
ncbi:MAG: NADH dehydrogenase subunit [Thermoplasmata archaeon]|nr:MAG: NADH dehydrogenase subunit [Thermoplasmata archaeon]